jgi:hypothetical protein
MGNSLQFVYQFCYLLPTDHWPLRLAGYLSKSAESINQHVWPEKKPFWGSFSSLRFFSHVSNMNFVYSRVVLSVAEGIWYFKQQERLFRVESTTVILLRTRIVIQTCDFYDLNNRWNARKNDWKVFTSLCGDMLGVVKIWSQFYVNENDILYKQSDSMFWTYSVW